MDRIQQHSDKAAPRVLHVVISLDHGGLERLVVDWTNLRNVRFPGLTRVVCLDRPGDLAAQVAGGAVRCLDANRAQWPWDLKAVRRLRGEFRVQGSGFSGQPEDNHERRSNPQCPISNATINHQPSTIPHLILHSHTLAAQQYAVLAAWGTRVRHVHTQHGAHVHLQSLLNRWRSRLLSRWTDRLVAVAQPAAEAMSRNQRIPRARIAVIPNGVTPHPACPAAEIAGLRRTYDLPARGGVIGSIGRLDRIKGYDRLLAALAELSAQGWDGVLLLVGDGPARPDLERQARDLRIEGRVRFAGFQGEPRKFLEVMDLFVLPSRSEGLSVALLEAMAAGVPVLVADVGSNREVVADGALGRLFPDNAAQWPQAIRDALAAGRCLADAARQRALSEFSAAATLDAYEQVYGSLAY